MFGRSLGERARSAGYLLRVGQLNLGAANLEKATACKGNTIKRDVGHTS